MNACVNFFKDSKRTHALEILPTGSGKSVVIANIAKELTEPTLVFQPSKEILEQNYAKYTSYGFPAGIYSASARQRRIEHVTFVTIGSVARKPHLFRKFRNIMVDEAHLVNAQEGMYRGFLDAIKGAKVLGLTATPYRLESTREGAQLTFLTRSEPRIFSRVLHYVQNGELFASGHLAPLEYYRFETFDRSLLETTANGADFTQASLQSMYRRIDMPGLTVRKALYILQHRRNLLVFCSLIEEANRVAACIPGSEVLHGGTDPVKRASILRRFKAGKIRCVVNVGVLTTGFDYPELEAVLVARSTMSLSLYYQIIGRVIRPYTYPDGSRKVGWVVDLGGNVDFFGKVEDLRIVVNSAGLYSVHGNGRQLTNVPFSKN